MQKHIDHLAGDSQCSSGSAVTTTAAAPIEIAPMMIDWKAGQIKRGEYVVAYLAGPCLTNPAIANAANALVSRYNAYEELLEACGAAKKLLEPDLVEPGRTVFWKLVAAIAKARGQTAAASSAWAAAGIATTATEKPDEAQGK